MEKYFLAVDIGNTSISLGLFLGDSLTNVFKYRTKDFEPDFFAEFIEKSLKEIDIEKRDIVDGIISSVVPSLSKLIQKSLKKVFDLEFQFLKLSDVRDIKLDVDEPETVGADLLADLVAAKTLYGYPTLIIDLGTLSKVLIINEKGDFDRCAFFPGMRLSLNAMNRGAELIPELQKVEYPKEFFGKNTNDAMMGGIYYSTSCVVARLIEHADEYVAKGTKVIISGGYAEVIGKSFEGQTIEPNLCLKGLNIIAKNKRI